MRKINVVILTPETAGAVGVSAVAYQFGYDFPSTMGPWMLPSMSDNQSFFHCQVGTITYDASKIFHKPMLVEGYLR